METRIGEIAAFVTALCWTCTALCFQSAGKKIGSISVNVIRIIIAFLCISVYNLVQRGMAFPSDASAHAWFWLSLSGCIGFFFGDVFLFKAYTLIGARISTLVFSAAPPLTALLGWVILGEILSLKAIIGMGITLSGISLAILKRNATANGSHFSQPLPGVLYALGGAVGQALAFVLSKLGIGQYDPFAATQIRLITAIPCFLILTSCIRAWPRVWAGLRDKQAMLFTSIGAIFGPFIGVSLSLLSIQYIPTGVTSTILALIPVLIILPSAVIFKEKITAKEITGAVISFFGIWVMCG